MGTRSKKLVIKKRVLPLFQTFGAHLKEQRERANLTQREAAERAGVTNAYVCLVETDQRQVPRPLLLLKFAEAYGASPTAILGRAGYINPMHFREHRLWMKERDEVLRHPVMVADMEEFGRQTYIAAREVMKRMGAMESWSKESAVQKSNELKRMFGDADERFQKAMEDPTVASSRRLKRRAKGMDQDLRLLISELHGKYRAERAWREALQERFIGEVTDVYRDRVPKNN